MNKKKSNLNLVESNTLYSLKAESNQPLPLLETYVSAGFPSIAENSIEKTLDLNELLIHHPAATFFIRVIGDSMKDAGINSNDILIIDRSLSVANNKIVVVRINNELTVKRVRQIESRLFLAPENSDYKPIEVTPEMDIEVWGVVTHVIHSV